MKVSESIKPRTQKIDVLGGWAPKGEGGVVPWRTITTEPRRPPHTTPRFKPVQASIYFGARNLDPKLGRWLSEDPALLEYLPVPEINDDAKKHNGQLPGMGGVFNSMNLNLWHYGGNNPIKFVDPTGSTIIVEGSIRGQLLYAFTINYLKQSPTFSRMYSTLESSNSVITIKLSKGIVLGSQRHLLGFVMLDLSIVALIPTMRTLIQLFGMHINRLV